MFFLIFFFIFVAMECVGWFRAHLRKRWFEKKNENWTAYAALWWNGGAKRAIKFWFWFVFNRWILISIPFFWNFANASMMHCKFRVVPCFIKINKKPFVKKKLKKIHKIRNFILFFYWFFFFCMFAAFFCFFFENFLNLFQYFSWNSRIRFKIFFISMTGNHELSENEYFIHHMKYWNWLW